MSGSFTSSVDRIKTLLRDRNAADQMFTPFEYNQNLQNECYRIMEEIGLNPTWETSVVTLVAGTYEYSVSVPAGKSFLHQIIELRLHSRNWPIQRITEDELEMMRRGPSNATGIPYWCSMFEKDDNTLSLRLWPIPVEVDTLDWLRSWVPLWSAPATDTIPLSDLGLRVLEKRVARNMLTSAAQPALDSRNLTKEIIPLWERDIEEGVALERQRINGLKRTGRLARSAY